MKITSFRRSSLLGNAKATLNAKANNNNTKANRNPKPESGNLFNISNQTVHDETIESKNIQEYNNPRLQTNNDNTKHNTDENNYVIMRIDNKAHTCNDGYGLLFFKRWEG